MERVYIIHRQDGNNQIIKASEAIQNAMEQERDGVKPTYKYRVSDDIPAGWLIWSTWEDGAGVVCKRPEDGKYIILTGWQGEFAFV